MTTKYKIISGFVCMIVILGVVSILSFRYLGGSLDGLNEFGRISRITVELGNATSNLNDARGQMNRYLAFFDESYIGNAVTDIDAVIAAIDSAIIDTQSADNLNLMQSIRSRASQYKDNLNQLLIDCRQLHNTYLGEVQDATAEITGLTDSFRQTALGANNSNVLAGIEQLWQEYAYMLSNLATYRYSRNAADLANVRQRYATALDHAENLSAVIVVEAGRQIHRQLLAAFTVVNEAITEMESVSNAAETSIGNVRTLSDGIAHDLTTLSTSYDQQMQANGVKVTADVSGGRIFMLICSGIGLLIGILLAAWAILGLSRVLRDVARFAGTVAKGDFNAEIKNKEKGEIGQMVTALRAMVSQLKEQLGFARGIMLGIVTPFAVVDTNGKLTYLNKQLLEYWGRSGKPEDYYGKKSGEFFRHSAEEKTPLDQALAEKRVLLDQPLAMSTARNEKKVMRVTASPLWDMDKNLLGACLLVTDETEIREQQDRILALNERISQSVQEAQDISRKQSEAFTSLRIQLDKTSEAALAQTKASDDTMRSVSEMSSTLDMLADQAKNTTDDTRATRSEAEEGYKVVNDTLDCINKVADYANRTEQGIRDLGEQAAGITHIVELIKDIADQTNLLALNAAIEAARAGETGRGFAVVADEVRKLAEKTMHATDDVNKSVSELQNVVEANQVLTSETVKLTKTSTELAGKSGERLSHIVEIAEHAVEKVLAISQDTAEQARVGMSISNAMEGISSMARQSTLNMNESISAVASLSQLSDELKTLVETMGSERRGAERFKLDSLYTISVDGQASSVSARIMDISLTGLRMELQNSKGMQFLEKAKITIKANNPPLNFILNGVSACIAWQDISFCGIEFDHKLNISGSDLKNMVNEI